MAQFELLTTRSVGKAVSFIKKAFEKKRELEYEIATMIMDYEDETGIAIDSIKYQRDITLPLRGTKYTALSIIIPADKVQNSESNPERKE